MCRQLYVRSTFQRRLCREDAAITYRTLRRGQLHGAETCIPCGGTLGSAVPRKAAVYRTRIRLHVLTRTKTPCGRLLIRAPARARASAQLPRRSLRFPSVAERCLFPVRRPVCRLCAKWRQGHSMGYMAASAAKDTIRSIRPRVAQITCRRLCGLPAHVGRAQRGTR